MHIREFDRDFANEVIERLSSLPPDRIPKWGAMKATELVPHLVHSMAWSMRRREPPPFIGNWATTHIVGPLVLRGWLPILRNVKIPLTAGSEGNPNDSLDDLRGILSDYLSAVETGALDPSLHPLFGDIGIDGWAKMHVRHFEHHFTQFGL